jgi:cyclophilin family peptidyl-prolyl cis-trans isomerase
MPRLLVPVLCVLALVSSACGDDDSGDSGSDAPAQAQADAGAASPGDCPDVQQPAPRADGKARRPTDPLDPDKRYDLILDTSCGQIDIRLDQRTSPRTAASVAGLARSGFYDGTVFHRIVPDFVIQGGDPTASGMGGPGYSTRDKPPADTAYLKGTVAMAKTETEPRGTSGSQFYIVTGADAGLPPDYAVLGKVVGGLDVAEKIGRLGDPASGGAGTPLKPVVIEKASVRGD